MEILQLLGARTVWLGDAPVLAKDSESKFAVYRRQDDKWRSLRRRGELLEIPEQEDVHLRAQTV